MTQPVPTASPGAPHDSPREHPGRFLLTSARRIPFTLALLLAIITVGVVTASFWHAASTQPWYPSVATGLPAFSEGRWWGVFTSPFVFGSPRSYLRLIPVVFVGFAEWRFGSLKTVFIFFGGQLVGVLVGAGIVSLVSIGGWHWAVHLTHEFASGPSAGAFACLAFALATLPSPWRLRFRFALGVWAAIEVLYLGQLSNVEHAVAIALALAVSGALPRYRHPLGRPSTREWRLLAFAGLLIIGVVQVIDLVLPYDGPLGQNQPDASFINVAIDVVVIALIANGVRRGFRVAWIIALCSSALNLAAAIFGVSLIPVFMELGIIDSPSELVALVIAPGVLWSAQLIILILGSGAFRVRMRRSKRGLGGAGIDRPTAVTRLRTLGGGTISWMLSWAPNQYLPVGDGVIAYQHYSGVAIALGDPVLGVEMPAEALKTFATAAEHAGYIPCVFSASPSVTAARPGGWRAVTIAEDTIVDLSTFTLSGKKMQSVRTSVNRAEREGITFRLVSLTDEPWGIRTQVRAISEQWAGDKGLPEMRFTLGTVDEAMDPEVRVGLAIDGEGTLHGITSWLPVYGPGGVVRGWTLDLMRRRDGGFGPVMEFLIGAAAQHFADEGYEFVSLSGAPLVRSANEATGPIEQLLDRLGSLAEPLYGFRSLHRFKQKFQPRSEALSLLYRDEGDLPRIAMALTRAYLPDATLRDLLASATPAAATSATPAVDHP